jgi:hypothetical protein
VSVSNLSRAGLRGWDWDCCDSLLLLMIAVLTGTQQRGAVLLWRDDGAVRTDGRQVAVSPNVLWCWCLISVWCALQVFNHAPWLQGRRHHLKKSCYSLRLILLFANTNVSRHILVIDIFVLAKSNMGRRKYLYLYSLSQKKRLTGRKGIHNDFWISKIKHQCFF